MDAKGTYDSGKAKGLDDVHAAEYSGAKTASKVGLTLGAMVLLAAVSVTPVGWTAIGLSLGVSFGVGKIVDYGDQRGLFDFTKGVK